MGKNKSGHYMPPKGKPSGSGHESHGLTDAFAGTDPERDNRIAKEYTDNESEKLSDNVPLKHANRHLHKGEDVPEYQQPPDNG
jgi:hypothetical protein